MYDHGLQLLIVNKVWIYVASPTGYKLQIIKHKINELKSKWIRNTDEYVPPPIFFLVITSVCQGESQQHLNRYI